MTLRLLRATKIKNKTPRVSLGFFPTPLHELKNLQAKIGGPRVFIKRDDLTGLALGGNKTRKLEFLVGDAIENGCDTLITGGAAQSNHCRQTAAAASKLGLKCHLSLSGKRPKLAQGNLLLDQLLGAEIHWAGRYRKGELLPEIEKRLREKGKSPYRIPYGGSSVLGALAFIEALHETITQWKNHFRELPFPKKIVFASSSGATHAGLILGKEILKIKTEIHGINIDKGETEEGSLEDTISSLISQTSRKLQISSKKRKILLDSRFTGKGYGVVGTLEKNAMKLLAQKEGILLDPVYTARAMGGLLQMIQNKELKKSDTVLFWHTGGQPAIFSHASNFESSLHTVRSKRKT